MNQTYLSNLQIYRFWIPPFLHRVTSLRAGTGHLPFTGHVCSQGSSGLTLAEITNLLWAWGQWTHAAPKGRETGPWRCIQRCSPAIWAMWHLGTQAEGLTALQLWQLSASRADLCLGEAFPQQLSVLQAVTGLCSHTDLTVFRSLQRRPEDTTASGETGFVSRTIVTQDNQELLIHEQPFQKILGLGDMGNTRVGPRWWESYNDFNVYSQWAQNKEDESPF